MNTGKNYRDAEILLQAQALALEMFNEAIWAQRAAERDAVLGGAMRTVEWLKRKRRETLTGRVLQQFGPRPKVNAKQAAAILELLESHGYLRQMVDPRARSPVYKVHPDLRPEWRTTELAS